MKNNYYTRFSPANRLLLLLILITSVTAFAQKPTPEEQIKAQEFYKRHFENAHPTAVETPELNFLIPLADPPTQSFFLNANMIEPETQSNQMQNESSIAVNPVNPKFLIGSAVDYRDTSATWVYISNDGGKSWINKKLGRPYTGWLSSNDPSVAFNAAGVGFLVYGGFGKINSSPLITGENGVFFARTTDNGLTWKAHIPVIVHQGVQTLDSTFEDKYYIYSDNSPKSKYPGHLYIPWKRVTPKDSATQIVISKSTDLGNTWSVPVNVSERLAGSSEDTTFGQSFPLAITGPNGEVYVVWNYGPKHSVGFAKSDDGGATFTAPKLIQTYNRFGITKEIEKNTFRHTVKGKVRAESYPSIACDITNGPRKGYLYLTYAGDNIPNIYFSRSTDGGDTWSSPVVVHSDTTNDQFWQWLSIDATNGDLAVMYLDSRDDKKNIMVATYVSYSSDGGITWKDSRAADISSDIRLNPFTNNAFAGDYSGCAFHNGIIYPSWIDMRSAVANIFDSDVYTAFININSPTPPKNFKVRIIPDEFKSLDLSWEPVLTSVFGKTINPANLNFILYRNNTKISVFNGNTSSYKDTTGIVSHQKYIYKLYACTPTDTSIASIDSAFAGGSVRPGNLVYVSHHRDGRKINFYLKVPSLRSDNTTPFVNPGDIKIFRDSVEVFAKPIANTDTGKVVKVFDEPPTEGFFRYSFSVTDNSQQANESARTADTIIFTGDIRTSYDFINGPKDSTSLATYYKYGNWGFAKIGSTNFLTDSPIGNYENSKNYWFTFYPYEMDKHEGTLEVNFSHAALVLDRDSAVMEYSVDFMNTWKEARTFNELSYTDWGDGILNNKDIKDEHVPINGLSGKDTVYIRIRLKSNISKVDDGWYISNLYIRNVSNVDDRLPENLKVYPQPVSNELTIDFGVRNIDAEYKFKLFNSIGNEQKVKIQQKGEGLINLDLSELSPGCYFIRFISTSGNIYCTKVIKI